MASSGACHWTNDLNDQGPTASPPPSPQLNDLKRNGEVNPMETSGTHQGNQPVTWRVVLGNMEGP